MIKIFINILLGCYLFANNQNPALLFVLDDSGSMGSADSSGQARIVSAKQSIITVLDKLNPGRVNVGLMTFGSDCSGNSVVQADLENTDFNFLKNKVYSIGANNGTPLANTIRNAGELVKSTSRDVTIMVLSDGAEGCGGDPLLEAKKIMKENPHIKIYTIGYDVYGNIQEVLENIAKVGKGEYADAKNQENLQNVFNSVATKEVTYRHPKIEKIIYEPASSTFGFDISFSGSDQNKYVTLNVPREKAYQFYLEIDKFSPKVLFNMKDNIATFNTLSFATKDKQYLTLNVEKQIDGFELKELQYTGDKKYLYSSSSNNSFTFLDPTTMEVLINLQTLPTGNFEIHKLSLDSNTSYEYLTLSNTKSLYILDSKSKKTLFEIKNINPLEYQKIFMSEDMKYVSLVSKNQKEIKFLDLINNQEILNLNTVLDSFISFHISNQNDFITLQMANETIKIFDIATKNEVITLSKEFKDYITISYSNDKKDLLVALSDKSYKIIELLTKQELPISKLLTNVSEIAFIDDNTLFVKYLDKKIKFLNKNNVDVNFKIVDYTQYMKFEKLYLRDDTKEIVLDPNKNLVWQDDKSVKKIKLPISKIDKGIFSTTITTPAQEYCKKLNLGGFENWRLPTISELNSIAVNTTNNAINKAFLNVEFDVYWTGTKAANNSSFSWNLDFVDGRNYTSNEYESHYIRCVRDQL